MIDSQEANPDSPNSGYGISTAPIQYGADGLWTIHNCAFLDDPRFKKAYDFGLTVETSAGQNLHIEWRVRVALWAAEQALLAEGDFIECGVYTGILSGSVCDWVNFENIPERCFWLLDTFDGLPEDQLIDGEKELKIYNYNSEYRRSGIYELVLNKFNKFPNVKIVKGQIPETLDFVQAEKIAYLSIDLNMAFPEMQALERFWPKLSPGAVILLDDYNQRLHVHQKNLIDEFARERKITVLPLPTGQGIIIKPSPPA